MKCSKCSTALNGNEKFCAECGTPVPKPEPKMPEPQEKISSIMTMSQAAKFMKVSRCQIYVLIKNDGLPYFWLGKRRRFIKDELLAWSKNRQVSA
ncbi:helix-turn-helix domain-containing protein [Acetonema longum]|uniref:Excision promoter, Xis n=1 Tax=Acetonema longum DSM 6540 TaxID=1009370 RepID=F7NKF4_9FIRM|nr:excision promoter, Xis [Acetonema longum DSM 6540]